MAASIATALLRRGKAERTGSTAGDGLAAAIGMLVTWGFGIWSVAVLLRSGLALMQDSGARVSLFGLDAAGRMRETWGLTYGGAGGLFDRHGFAQFAGLEGPLLASGQAALVVLALMCTLVPSKDARIFAGSVLVLWAGLWAMNAAYQSLHHFSPLMAAALALSMMVLFLVAQHTSKAARAV